MLLPLLLACSPAPATAAGVQDALGDLVAASVERPWTIEVEPAPPFLRLATRGLFSLDEARSPGQTAALVSAVAFEAGPGATAWIEPASGEIRCGHDLPVALGDAAIAAHGPALVQACSATRQRLRDAVAP